jgi:hypothetical protein
MLCFVLEYRKPIDLVTADKGLKLRKFELDEEEWGVMEDLVDILEVSQPFMFDFNVPTSSA